MNIKKRNETITKGILDNERCQVCGRKVNKKCLTCLLNNQTAGYHDNHHFEKNHRPLWLGVHE